jgi:DNA-binding GntR family transcriptional regulator
LLVQEFTASLIPPELAAPLQVSAGSAAISVRRMYRTAQGKLVFITVETYPAERFRYTTALHRDGPNKSLPL